MLCCATAKACRPAIIWLEAPVVVKELSQRGLMALPLVLGPHKANYTFCTEGCPQVEVMHPWISRNV